MRKTHPEALLSGEKKGGWRSVKLLERDKGACVRTGYQGDMRLVVSAESGRCPRRVGGESWYEVEGGGGVLEAAGAGVSCPFPV